MYDQSNQNKKNSSYLLIIVPLPVIINDFQYILENKSEEDIMGWTKSK